MTETMPHEVGTLSPEQQQQLATQCQSNVEQLARQERFMEATLELFAPLVNQLVDAAFTHNQLLSAVSQVMTRWSDDGCQASGRRVSINGITASAFDPQQRILELVEQAVSLQIEGEKSNV